MNQHVPAFADQRPATVRLRDRLEDEIERLIAMLDGVDGDENVEDSADDEPSLGGLSLCAGGGKAEVDLELDAAERSDEEGNDFIAGGGSGI